MKITIANDKASATVICRDLILDDSVAGARNLLYLTAYGPTQEIRAFAQILAMKGSFECHGKEDRSINIWSNHPLRIIPKMGEGYSGVYITPSSDSSFLIGNSKADCYQVFTRILDQREFVHRDWYEALFNEVSTEIEPLVGKKRCWKYRAHELKSEIVNRLKYGGLKMPPATAHFTIERRNAMSTLANSTDKKFLLAALRAIRELDRANIGDITKEDDADMCAARNHLLAVIQSNGYQINYDTYRLIKAS